MSRPKAAAAAKADETDSEDQPLEVRYKELRRKKFSRKSAEESREDDAPLADLVQLHTAKRRRKKPAKAHLGVSGRSLMRYKPSGHGAMKLQHEEMKLQRRVTAAAGDDRGAGAAGKQGATTQGADRGAGAVGKQGASTQGDNSESGDAGKQGSSTQSASTQGASTQGASTQGALTQGASTQSASTQGDDRVAGAAGQHGASMQGAGSTNGAARTARSGRSGPGAHEDTVLKGPFKLVKRETKEDHKRKRKKEWYILGCRNAYIIGCSQSRSSNYQGIIAGIHGALTRGEIRTKSEAHFMLRRMLAPAAKELRIMDAD